MRALITGGSGGLGLAIAAALGDAEIVSLGLEEGFDVGDADAWRAVDGEFDAAFLNAGIVTREDRHGCADGRAVPARRRPAALA